MKLHTLRTLVNSIDQHEQFFIMDNMKFYKRINTLSRTVMYYVYSIVHFVYFTNKICLFRKNYNEVRSSINK